MCMCDVYRCVCTMCMCDVYRCVCMCVCVCVCVCVLESGWHVRVFVPGCLFVLSVNQSMMRSAIIDRPTCNLI